MQAGATGGLWRARGLRARPAAGPDGATRTMRTVRSGARASTTQPSTSAWSAPAAVAMSMAMPLTMAIAWPPPIRWPAAAVTCAMAAAWLASDNPGVHGRPCDSQQPCGGASEKAAASHAAAPFRGSAARQGVTASHAVGAAHPARGPWGRLDRAGRRVVGRSVGRATETSVGRS